MKSLLMYLTLLAFQMNSMQDKPVVHLDPHRNTISSGFGGKLLELINAPDIIYLPTSPPLLDSSGQAWSVDVKNLGPREVTLSGKAPFKQPIHVGQTLRIQWDGKAYSLRNP